FPVLARELTEFVAGRRRARLDRLVLQIALPVAGKAVGRFVTPRAVLVQTTHPDPVQLAAHQRPQPSRLPLAPRRPPCPARAAPTPLTASRPAYSAVCSAGAAPPRG